MASRKEQKNNLRITKDGVFLNDTEVRGCIKVDILEIEPKGTARAVMSVEVDVLGAECPIENGIG